MFNPAFYSNPSEYREFAATQNPGFQEIATRRMAEFVSVARHLPNPDEVLRKLGKSTTAVYRQLLVDARVWAAVQSRKTGIQSLDWQIEPGEAAAAHVEFVEDLFTTYDVPRILGDFLNAPLFGLQPMERLWEVSGRYTIARDLVGKPIEWFIYNNEGQLRFLKMGSGTDGVEVEPYAFQVARHEATYQNPYGFPILSCCFWPVAFKKGSKKFRAVHAEKWGMPHAYALIPPGTPKEKVKEYLEQLDNLVQDGVATIYDNAKINLVESAGKGESGGLYQGQIDDCNADIVTAILGHQGAQASTPGKLGQEQMATEVREDIVWADKNLCVKEMNVLIKDLVRINFGETAKAPLFAFYEKEDVDATLADRDKKLAEIGDIEFTDEYYIEKHGLKKEHFRRKAKPVTPVEPAPGPTPPPVQPVLPTPPVELAKPPALLEQEEAVREAQETLEALVAAVPPEEMQGFVEDAVAPVLKVIREAKGYDEVKALLAAQFPKMDSGRFETILGRAVFLAEAIGQES